MSFFSPTHLFYFPCGWKCAKLDSELFKNSHVHCGFLTLLCFSGIWITVNEASDVASDLAAKLINFCIKMPVDGYIAKVDDTLKQLSFVEVSNLKTLKLDDTLKQLSLLKLVIC